MRQKLWIILGAIVLVAVGGALAWQQFNDGQLAPGGATDHITVAATIFPLADIVQQIGGEELTVVLLIPPGASEHSSAFTPRQLVELQDAALLLAVGQGLDDNLVERVTNVRPIPVVVADHGIQLREFTVYHEHEGEEEEEEHEEMFSVDPHYWLTVPNGQHIARNIAQELTERFPDKAEIWQRNLELYLAELEVLEHELQNQAKNLKQRHFIAMHDAWSYWADHYGLELVGTYEPIEGQQPSLADLQALRGLIERYGIKVFYAEPQKASSAATRFLSEEFGLTILTLDPVGGVDDRDSYANLMRFNMESIMVGQ